MTEILHEQLSALADDELDYMQVELLLRRYATDAQLRKRWSAYHVIGEALRDANPQANACCIADRVAAQLSTTPSAQSEPTRAPARWWRPVGVAAAVVVVGLTVVMVRQQSPQQVPATTTAPALASHSAQAPAVANVRHAPSQGISAVPVRYPAVRHAPVRYEHAAAHMRQQSLLSQLQAQIARLQTLPAHPTMVQSAALQPQPVPELNLAALAAQPYINHKPAGSIAANHYGAQLVNAGLRSH